MKYVLVTGSHRLTYEQQEWTQRATRSRLEQIEPLDAVMFHGGADGVDDTCARYAKYLQWREIRMFPAQWREYHNGAGHIRNGVMAKEVLWSMTYRESDFTEALCLAFLPKGHWSPGTKGMVNKAIKSGFFVEVWVPKSANASELVSELDGTPDVGSVMFLVAN